MNNRWQVLALLFLCRTSLGVQFQTLGSVAQPLRLELGLSFAQVGTLIGLFLLPGLFLALPAGAAGRFASDKKLVASGLLVMGLGGLLAGAAQGFGQLAAARLISGVGFVLGTLYFTKMVADWFSGKELATAMGVLVMSWPFGIALGQVAHEWLAAQASWRVPFVVASCYCLLASAFVLLYRRPGGPQAAALPLPAATTATTWWLPRKEFLLTGLAATAWGLFNGAYIVFLSYAPRVLEGQGHSTAQAANIISLASWVMMFSGAACGQLADRTGRHNVILAVCMAVAATCMWLLLLGQHVALVCLLFGLVGASPAGIIMALTGQAMAAQRRAFGMGVFLTLYFMLVAPAPAAAGWLFDYFQNVKAPLIFAAALFIATALAYGAFRAAQRYVVDRPADPAIHKGAT